MLLDRVLLQRLLINVGILHIILNRRMYNVIFCLVCVRQIQDGEIR